MRDETIIEAARPVLAALEAPKLWMTARVLARRLRKQRPELGGISQIELFEALARHAARGRDHRTIRNSPVPSERTLEVLWGAVERVGELGVEPPFLRTVSPDDDPAALLDAARNPVDADVPEEDHEEDDAEPPFFLSYSFDDSAAAKEIAGALERKGYSIWMAGTQIALGDFINEQVREAIGKSRGLLLYLSADSLRSLWVAKEQLVGEGLRLERTIIVKGDDPDLMALLSHWISPVPLRPGAGEPGIPLEQVVSYNVASRFRELLRETLGRAGSVVYLHPEGGQADGERLLGLSAFPPARPRI
ncbi:MAG: toll/interleukin-1 receptor domain-containing protein [Gammaproteobacteria bacterium]|nr:toll/interleukin-1 receptor domain-containing protein [Gammaproteobacteria bacterium]NIR85624.1 toll/interleukin-1 receptor domain-containing protein [Gammaproteobacteria bacterium]NIR90112.1 toll/interleukin-1 receptor domain-containing protein [Gammaproteobacteria bacterium]NIU06758.1 toll/interleukin-1 receptor domain-containing protein [Gammaproteobacteria bacterium]NIV53691.1 TIR domain-containing protein [Gammaproteobacteria bacterium]